jgi:hypothetical protein
MNESKEPERFARVEGLMAAAWNATAMRKRIALVTAGLAIVTAGIAANWSTLVAAGIAPLIISALPCAVMCALGLCMSGLGRRSCASEAESQHAAETSENSRLNSLAGRTDGPVPGDQSVDQPQVEMEPLHLEREQERRSANA